MARFWFLLDIPDDMEASTFEAMKYNIEFIYGVRFIKSKVNDDCFRKKEVRGDVDKEIGGKEIFFSGL